MIHWHRMTKSYRSTSLPVVSFILIQKFINLKKRQIGLVYVVDVYEKLSANYHYRHSPVLFWSRFSALLSVLPNILDLMTDENQWFRALELVLKVDVSTLIFSGTTLMNGSLSLIQQNIFQVKFQIVRNISKHLICKA